MGTDRNQLNLTKTKNSMHKAVGGDLHLHDVSSQKPYNLNHYTLIAEYITC